MELFPERRLKGFHPLVTVFTVGLLSLAVESSPGQLFFHVSRLQESSASDEVQKETEVVENMRGKLR